eukprot:COSAG05_NODE_3799_length_1832_cov_2477.389498_2_plen_74_part_00
MAQDSSHRIEMHSQSRHNKLSGRTEYDGLVGEYEGLVGEYEGLVGCANASVGSASAIRHKAQMSSQAYASDRV